MKQLIFILCLVGIFQLTLTSSTYDKHLGSVVTNGLECAKIGADIFKDGGSAADAAIAATFCESVACPQLIGLGGGFLATIYIRQNRTGQFLNARETAPAMATVEMYNNDFKKAEKGGLAVAVPGTLKGLWELHQRHGRLDWRRLVQPSIDLCFTGVEVTPWQAKNFKQYEKRIRKNPSLKEIFINPSTNQTYVVGQKIKRPKLGETYRIIAEHGVDALYTQDGLLLRNFIGDIQSLGGIISEEDMENYRTEWQPIKKSPLFGNRKLIAAPLPGSGPLLEFFLNTFDATLNNCSNNCIEDTAEFWHKIVEIFKFGFAERTKLGDPKFIPNIKSTLDHLKSQNFIQEVVSKIRRYSTSNDTSYYGASLAQNLDHGTAHISVLAPNGDAVALTGSLNFFFGAGIRSTSTGIILNNQMADFTFPGQKRGELKMTEANVLVPGKRPLSSMTPFVLTDVEGNVKLVAGSAGGAKITEALFNFLIQKFYFDKGLASSISAPRIYHHLIPMEIEYDEGFDEAIINRLKWYGHGVKQSSSGPALTVIYNSTNTNQIYASFDPRRGGSVAYV